MRLAVISDVHSNLEAFQAVLTKIDEVGVDRIYHLGDIVGYNTNPNECVDILRERNIHTIMGNHDAAACGLEDPWFFRSAAKKAALWTGDQLRDDVREFLRGLPDEATFDGGCLGVHGSPTSRDDYIIDWLDAMRQLEYLNGRPIDIVFFGHSHKVSLFSERGTTHSLEAAQEHKLQRNNRYFINTGAVGQPRDRDPRAAFGVLDTESLVIQFHRVPYDVETTCEKIVRAGLPVKLARRLHQGK
jgi:diadenosine tetraphosphatase ApaH/serine/threonine PP2A family protein phosphatase